MVPQPRARASSWGEREEEGERRERRRREEARQRREEELRRDDDLRREEERWRSFYGYGSRGGAEVYREEVVATRCREEGRLGVREERRVGVREEEMLGREERGFLLGMEEGGYSPPSRFEVRRSVGPLRSTIGGPPIAE